MTSERKDINAVVTGLLRDLAAAQSSPQKSFGYRRTATAIFDLEQPLAALVDAAGSLQKIAGVGPATARVVVEVLEHGDSPTVERAIAQSGKALEIERRRALRDRFLSRSEVVRIMADQKLSGRTPLPYKGDLQVHSEWSDGSPTIAQLAEAGLQRGYAHIGVTDHSHGLAIASGMTMAEVLQQHAEIDRVNHDYAGRFRIIKGIEANIGADGDLDLSDDEVDLFELVLAAPHSKLRRAEDQTDRMLRAVSVRGMHILAHPRGRISGTPAGIVANWNRVFDSAARANVAIEIDGDPSRQDLDYALAAQALDAGCLFALDSDAHSTDQLQYTDTGIAHARLADIPSPRIINCWPVPKLVEWLGEKRRARGTPRTRGARRPSSK